MSKALKALAILDAPVSDRLPVAIALRDLDVAPENLRYGEPADDGVPELAETIAAAGVLQPLAARPGGRREAAAMALDGRRRLLALRLLLEAGRITDDYPVPCFVETDPARQAAALVLTNTAVPVHVADVIVAIGKMLKAKLTAEAIAAALGYAEVDIRRLAALSDLHDKAIEALKAGRINLRQAKLLARLPNRKEQGEIADAAMSGFGFQEWRITDRLDSGEVTVRDRRYRIVGAARYAAAGGRVLSDLFGERPDVVLDPEVLQAAWLVRAEALAAGLAAPGVQIQVSVAPAEIDDPVFEPFGHAYGMGLDDAELDLWREAEAAARDAQSALADLDLSAHDADAAIVAALGAKLAADIAGEPRREVTLIQVFCDASAGLSLSAYGPPVPAVQDEDDRVGEAGPGEDGEGDATDAPAPGARAADAMPIALAPRPDLEGVGHALHEVRTDMATRALVRALADDPGTALVAVVARLFGVLVLQSGRCRGDGALTIDANPYGRPNRAPIETLDGEVWRRLAARRAAWSATGLSPIAWVSGLAHGEKMALLAEVVALSLDLREERTSSVRRAARAEAVEIAALCSADVTRHWTPDEAFLSAHPKGKLLDMLDVMGAGESRAAACKKDELVSLVAARAAERRWAPADLSWSAEPPQAPAECDPDEESPPQSGASGEAETQALSAPLAA